MILVGGATGAFLRYLVSEFANRMLSKGFPWGTLSVNLLGCFVIGLLWSITKQYSLPEGLHAFLFIGLLGAFTTFSTFGLESLTLLENGKLLLGFANIAFSNILGLMLVWIGAHLSDWLFTLLNVS